MEWAVALYPALPLFIVAESMGGCVALLATLPHTRTSAHVAGCVLLAPMCTLHPKLELHPITRAAVMALSRWLPWLPVVPNGGDLGVRVSRDPEAVRVLADDPLVYKAPARIGTIAAGLVAMERLQACMHQVSVPFIVMHGDGDVITSPAGSEMLYQRAASSDKAFKARCLGATECD